MKKAGGNMLILLFSITYMISYITRKNYGVIISEMVTDTGFSKQMLSLAVTGSFITYGVGQILSGILGDKLSPKRLVSVGLLMTISMNLIIPFASKIWLKTLIWSINGLAQAFMWPPIVKLMVALFDKEKYDKGIVKVSWGSNMGTILLYLSAPLIITITGWRAVFWVSAALAAIMLIIWQIFCPDIKNIELKTTKCNKEPADKAKKAKFITPVFLILALSIVICGMLRDGVETWTPSLISENFALENEYGILLSVALPIFGVLCFELASFLYRKKFKNPVTCASLIFAIGVMGGILLILFLGRSSVMTVLSIAILNGSMHGVNLMLISMVPSFYASTGKVSTVSGVINSFIYIGSAISTFGIAVLTERAGWTVTVIIWTVLAAIGTAICLLIARPWEKSCSQL